jgi:TolB-like protein/Tfp pilus assembly protein PilF
LTDTPTERESASAIGLPIVLVVGWYHGERGQQRVSGPELALLTLLLLIGVGLLWLYAQRSAPTTTDVTAVKPTPTSASDARPSIAVLPFESRLEDDAFFVDGIHDDIITQLSKVGALRVISRTSVEQFRDTKLPMKAIADQLGVTKILEGGVQRAGGRVRIHMQLIDAAADEHLWAESYDRDLTAANIFAIQSEMAEAIAAALRTALTRTEHAQAQILPTRSLAAWEAYQLGKQRMASRTSAGLAEAERHSRRGVAVDPRFALAWVGLADSLAFQTSYSGRSKDAGLREADQAVARALELHPTLAEAWATAGRIAFNRRQFARAEELLSRAIALNPNHALAHAWLTIALLELGRRNEALAMAESAVVLDPLSVVINANLGRARMEVGRFDEARVAFGQAIKIDPTTPMAYSFIAATFAEELGRLDRALPWYEKAASLDPGSPNLLANVAARYWSSGKTPRPDDGWREHWLSAKAEATWSRRAGMRGWPLRWIRGICFICGTSTFAMATLRRPAHGTLRRFRTCSPETCLRSRTIETPWRLSNSR